jgi:hypothetical protein
MLSEENWVGLHYTRFQKTHVAATALISKVTPKIAQKQRQLRKSG